MFDDEEEEGFFEGNLNEDLEKFENFLNGEPIGFLDSDRWEALIDHLLMNGKYQNAAICADEALAQFSYNTSFKLRKAQSFSALGELKEAINILSDLERQGMRSFELLLTKASIFSQLKDSKNAIKYFRHALSEAIAEDRDEVYLDLAMEYENMDNYKAALLTLEEAIRVNPKNESAIYEIAFCYDKLGQFEKSIKCYSDFIDENPYSFTAWYNLGNAYSKVENFDKAIWAYDYCILINDDFGPVYFNIANAYLALEKYTKAIENFHKCIELDGDDPVAFCYIGECHEQLNELELAKHFYKASLELAPLMPDSWLGLGIVEDLEGRTQEGITLIEKAISLDPENAGMYHVLAGAYEKIDQFDLAAEYYEMSLAFDPLDEECLTNYVGMLLEQSILEAYDFVKSFQESTPENKIASILMVNVLWRMGKYDDALNLFKLALIEDREKALTLFEINPELKNVKEFIHLSE